MKEHAQHVKAFKVAEERGYRSRRRYFLDW